jgi:hypothetical protein
MFWLFLAAYIVSSQGQAFQYDENLAVRMTEYSFAAYGDYYSIRGWNCSCCSLVKGVTNVETFGNSQEDLFGFVATDPQLGKVISFRGTVDLENWITNLKFAKSSPYGNDPAVKVIKSCIYSFC